MCFMYFVILSVLEENTVTIFIRRVFSAPIVLKNLDEPCIITNLFTKISITIVPGIESVTLWIVLRHADHSANEVATFNFLQLTTLLMKPGGSMPHSQGLSNNPYPEPN